MKKLLLSALVVSAMSSTVSAAGVPHTFVAGEKAVAAHVNENFEYLAAKIANNEVAKNEIVYGNNGVKVPFLKFIRWSSDRKFAVAEIVNPKEIYFTNVQDGLRLLVNSVGSVNAVDTYDERSTYFYEDSTCTPVPDNNLSFLHTGGFSDNEANISLINTSGQGNALDGYHVAYKAPQKPSMPLYVIDEDNNCKEATVENKLLPSTDKGWKVLEKVNESVFTIMPTNLEVKAVK